MGLLYFGLPLLLIVIGPLLVYNSFKGMRSGEGMYDSESTGIMTAGGIAGILTGLAMTAWSAWRLWRTLSAALW